MNEDELIEKMARAIDPEADCEADRFLASEQARAILSLLPTLGLAIVPVEATRAMLENAVDAESEWRKMPMPKDRMRLHWAALLAYYPFYKEPKQ